MVRKRLIYGSKCFCDLWALFSWSILFQVHYSTIVVKLFFNFETMPNNIYYSCWVFIVWKVYCKGSQKGQFLLFFHCIRVLRYSQKMRHVTRESWVFMYIVNYWEIKHRCVTKGWDPKPAQNVVQAQRFCNVYQTAWNGKFQKKS